MSATIPTTTISQGFKALPLSITQLSLSAVLKCGQSFRWTSFPLQGGAPDSETREMVWEPTHEWRFCLKDRVVCLRQTEDFLFYRSVFPGRELEFGTSAFKASGISGSEEETLRFIQDYFQLDIDLPGLYDTWSANDPVFRNLRSRFKGIRMLRQDPWECLISFICSSNNNISRISQMVQNLCKHFSPPLVYLPDPIPLSSPNSTKAKADDSCPPTPPSSSPPDSSLSTLPLMTTYHPFPPPSCLSSPSVSTKLRALGFGYRAEYIQKTASMLLEANGNTDEGVFKFLEGLRSAETEKAREELMKCVGVGRKVADCILLMSLDKREVIPVDTHVHQIALKHYGLRGSSSTSNNKKTMSPKLYDEVNERLAKIWGDYAGWAHSVLFTADLKSFSTYGLPTPSSTPSPPTVSTTPSPLSSPSPSPSTSPTKSRIKARTNASSSRASRASRMVQLESITPPETPPSSHKKRKQLETSTVNVSFRAVMNAMGDQEKEDLSPDGSGDLADRVKRRRRIVKPVNVNKQSKVMKD